jgi:hypothetical protein
MLNVERFHQLCREAEEAKDARRLFETEKRLVDLLQEEQLELLARERHGRTDNFSRDSGKNLR